MIEHLVIIIKGGFLQHLRSNITFIIIYYLTLDDNRINIIILFILWSLVSG